MATGKLGEKYSSRQTELTNIDESVEVSYYIYGSPDENDAKAVLIANAPATFTGQKGTMVPKKYAASATADKLGRFTGTVTYNLYGPKQTGETVFNFNTTGGTQHISFSKGNVARYPSGTGTGSAPDLGGAINVSSNDVGGTDITIPAFGFSATMYCSSGLVTSSFVNNLYLLTGKTNSGTWSATIDGIGLSFQDGEVLYLGAQGSRRGIGDVEITHNFAFSPNATNLTVVNFTGIAKKGWEFIWVRLNQNSLGTGTNVTINALPQFVYVEKVYDQSAFSVLGLPT